MSNSGLVCKKLTKVYDSGTLALDRVSFSIPTRGIFALIGRNGAGKTTLIRILATELMPTSGKAFIDGLDVVEDAEKLREIIAVLPQEGRTIPWLTAEQQVYATLLYRGFGTAEARKRAREVLERLGLWQYAKIPTRKLSGGTKRKLLVAGIVASGARILFVDEPTTGLDPLSRLDMWKMLSALKKDHFVFLTTHYLEEAERLANIIGIMEQGRLVGIGTLEELRSMVRYQYSIRLPKRMDIKPKEGIVNIGVDGSMQILATQEYASKISEKLIKKRIRFSMNPLSLEDIFYYLVKKPIEEGEEEGGT